jgi:hypothetical protein
MNVSLGNPVVRAPETITGSLGVVGARFILDGAPSRGRFSLVEHPIVARGMAAPLHRHTREDEYSYILEGRWGFWQGETRRRTSPRYGHTRLGAGLPAQLIVESTQELWTAPISHSPESKPWGGSLKRRRVTPATSHDFGLALREIDDRRRLSTAVAGIDDGVDGVA